MENNNGMGDSGEGDLSRREKGFLDRLSSKYEHSETAGQTRSTLIAAIVIFALFAAARWIPWWGAALILVEVLGLYLFRQYKRFAQFKSALLAKLWQQLKKASS